MQASASHPRSRRASHTPIFDCDPEIVQKSEGDSEWSNWLSERFQQPFPGEISEETKII